MAAILVIACARLMLLELCTYSNCPLSMSKNSFHSFKFFFETISMSSKGGGGGGGGVNAPAR